MKRAFLLGLFMLLIPFALLAQNITVSGTVLDATDGSTLPGACIIVQGSTIGTVSDLDGNFILQNVPPNAVLVVSSVQMQSQTIEVQGRTKLPLIKLSRHKKGSSKKGKNGKKKGDLDELD